MPAGCHSVGIRAGGLMLFQVFDQGSICLELYGYCKWMLVIYLFHNGKETGLCVDRNT